ncbi:hypothetical protein F2Q69_00005803 [Brassica cretica]|uniref:Uncharacterized protein n=1 Tax=Brassica cretica TaxID=69181 RepID=A0A8S9PHD6_BRACR|nr:hypothetical protein F2Q69_00005803 [Brassica cretica]
MPSIVGYTNAIGQYTINTKPGKNNTRSGCYEMSWGLGLFIETATNQLQVGGSPCVASHGSGRMRGSTLCSTWLAACPGHMQDATTPPRCQDT